MTSPVDHVLINTSFKVGDGVNMFTDMTCAHCMHSERHVHPKAINVQGTIDEFASEHRDCEYSKIEDIPDLTTTRFLERRLKALKNPQRKGRR